MAQTKRRRKLSDLYVRGTEITFDDGNGEPVVIWLQKPNPLESSTIIRRANAERARTTALRRDPESEEYQAFCEEVEGIDDKKVLAEYLIIDEIAKADQTYDAKLSEEGEWAENDYLKGLRETWEDGLKDRYVTDPHDPEAVKVYNELKRFADAVQEEVDALREQLMDDFQSLDIEVLRDQALDQMFRTQADLAWMREFRRCQLWMGVRDPDDHSERYFENREELDTLSPVVLERLHNAMEQLMVDVQEGKD